MFLSIYFLVPTMVGNAADDGRHHCDDGEHCLPTMVGTKKTPAYFLPCFRYTKVRNNFF